MEALVNEAEKGLGWNLQGEREKDASVVCSGKFHSVVEGSCGKAYFVDCCPALSSQEQRLLHEAAQVFQTGKGKAGGAAQAFQRRGKDEGKAELRQFLKVYCFQNMVLLEKKQVEYILLLLEKHLFGFGPFDFFLSDAEIEEIAVIGLGKEKPVHVFHRNFGWLPSNVFFLSGQTVIDLVNRMARCIGRRLTMNSPVLNATLPDGSRLSAAINPVSFSGPAVTIRKFSQQPFTPADLVANMTFSPDLMALLWIAMQCDCSVLIAGNTGSGKTSSLNALLSFVPAFERIVVVEETPEIRVQHRHFVKLNVVKEQGLGMQRLIGESLRMRPDRIIVGEVRTAGEVAAFIDTMLAGQGKGSYATFHAQSVRDAVNRLRSLGALELDLAAIDLVLVQRRWNRLGQGRENNETRRIVEAAELSEREGRIEFNSLFEFDYGKDALVKVGGSARVFEKARRCFGFGKREWEQELGKRSRFLAKMQKKACSYKDFFKAVNSFGGKQFEGNTA